MNHLGRTFVAMSGLVFTALLGACVEGEALGEASQETTSSGTVGVILARASLGDAETEIKWNGEVAKVEGPTDLVLQEITIQPGGNTGWHTHGGMAIVTIVSGTLSLFDSENPCDGHDYPAGKAFVDPGSGHVHIARNLGTTPVSVRVQYILNAGQAIRIDAPAPAGAELCQ